MMELLLDLHEETVYAITSDMHLQQFTHVLSHF